MTIPAPRSQMALGIAFAAASFGLYSTMDMLIKLMATSGYHVAQVAFFNALFGLVPLSFLILRRGGGLAALRTRRLRWHLARGVIGILGALCSFYGYSVMPMAEAYSIAFAAPLFITALSVPILKEDVGWRRWTAVGVGFAGVMVMLQPGAGSIGLGALAVLFGAFSYAISVVIIRLISRHESDAAMILYPSLIAITVTGAFLPFVGRMPSLADLGIFAACGITGGIAAICLVQAFRRAPAVVVAPFQYTQLLWGVFYGAVIFGNIPGPWTWIGAPIVIGSGLYILHRETRRAAEAAAPAVAKVTAPGAVRAA